MFTASGRGDCLAPRVPLWTHASKTNKQGAEFWHTVGARAAAALSVGLPTIHGCGTGESSDSVAQPHNQHRAGVLPVQASKVNEQSSHSEGKCRSHTGHQGSHYPSRAP